MTRFSVLFLSFFMCALAGFASDSSDEEPVQTLTLSQAEMEGFVLMLSHRTNTSEPTINQLADATKTEPLGYIASLNHHLRDHGSLFLACLAGYHGFNILTNCCSCAYNTSWWGGITAAAGLITFKVVLPVVDRAFASREEDTLGIRRFMTKANKLRVDGKKVIEIKKENDDSYVINILSTDLESIKFRTICFKGNKDL